MEACIRFIKWTTKKCIDTKSDTHTPLLQIRSPPLWPGLPNPTTLLFNNAIQGIMLIFSRTPLSPNNDDKHYEALVEKQTIKDKNHSTPSNYDFIPIESTVAVQWEDGGPWTDGTVVEKGDHNHDNRSYTVYIRKTGQLNTRNSKQVMTTQITAKQYLWPVRQTQNNRSCRRHS